MYIESSLLKQRMLMRYGAFMDGGFLAIRGRPTIFRNWPSGIFQTEPGTFQDFQSGNTEFTHYHWNEEPPAYQTIVWLSFDDPAFLSPEGNEVEIIALPFTPVTASQIDLTYERYHGQDLVTGQVEYWQASEVAIYDRTQQRLFDLPVRPFWQETQSLGGEMRLREGWIKADSFFSIYRFSIRMS